MTTKNKKTKKKKSKKKKPSKERGENYLIKIVPNFLATRIYNWENLEGTLTLKENPLDKDNNINQEGTDLCIHLMSCFIYELKKNLLESDEYISLILKNRLAYSKVDDEFIKIYCKINHQY